MVGFCKRITIVCGHYGSGKTNFAVNLAVKKKRQGSDVTLVDLDIVNPYFRSADFTEVLNANGITTINPTFANTNLDIPSLTANINGIFEQKSRTAVIDVGGDDAGAAALGRYSNMLKEEDDYDLFYMINSYRYLTKSPKEAVQILREIEAASRVNATGIINNSNLSYDTSAQTVLASLDYANAVASEAGIPIVATCYDKSLDKDISSLGGVTNPYPIDIYVKPPWEEKTELKI
ncbi:MAG: hypothetical protein RSA00_01760 [Hydrogenoanaerobacterium sp.]